MKQLCRLNFDNWLKSNVDKSAGKNFDLLKILTKCTSSFFQKYNVFVRILGIERLMSNLLNEWGTDIKRNQIPRILGGVGPMHSFRQLSKHLVIKIEKTQDA